ncbi:MAG: hypothetical protein MUE73_14345 [Planctomycetes bacterium]|jgi:hypothetical protein|nr:hypothetical protein [Planctomycetota bacterium]
MDWLTRLDRRWLYLAMAVVVAVPFLEKWTFPIIPSAAARKIYDTVEALPPDSVVLFSADYDPGSEAELYPMTVAIFEHLARKNLRLVITQLWPNADPLVQEALKTTLIPAGKVYGKDYVNLGYRPGGSILISKCFDDIPQAFKTDKDGTRIADIEAMRGVGKLGDVDLFIVISAGTPGIQEWVEQGQARTGRPMASGMTAVSAPDFFQYVNSNNLIGILGGLRGAADYEQLVGRPGRGSLGMAPQSFGHLLIVLFIVLGNIGFLLARRRSRRAS